MALTSRAGNVIFQFKNENRTHITPPLVFPDATLTSSFSVSFWVKPNTTGVPQPISTYFGTNGTYIYFFWNGAQWVLELRITQLVVARFVFFENPDIINKWRPFCIVRTPAGVTLYAGVALGTPDPDNPISMVQVYNYPTTELLFDFREFSIVASPHVTICDVKVWNTVVDPTDMTLLVNNWDGRGGTVTPPPIWACPLRTGDPSNISRINNSLFWNEEHSWSAIDFPNNLVFDSHDPEYMAKHQITPAWMYPAGSAPINFNPGLTPIIPTTFLSPDFVRFPDQGTIPHNIPLQYMFYLGWPTNDGTGVPQSNTWALFKDEDGNTNNPGPDPNYEITQSDTLSLIPPTMDNTDKLFKWSFGAQFKWQGSSPQVPAATAILANPLLFVGYIGNPTGVQALPVDDLIGLFVIKKGRTSDGYYRQTELPIPDPTIRTALIGE